MTSCLQCGHQDPGEFLFCPRCGTKAVAGGVATDPLLGRILNGKYRVEREIGQGAMGTVYLGEHIGLKKQLALKVLHSDLEVSDESLQRFQREGMAAGRFSHPHAIQIFDFDRSESAPGRSRVFYLAMEYVDGANLTLFLRQKGRLPVAMAVKLARQMLSCLAEAHRHGIVHRDLKPDNIMVSEGSRGELRLKVLDFGLSKLVDRKLGSSLMTQPGRLLGTPLYMAPEQLQGEEADERSDVYAAGLILYEMLAGERPFKEKDSAQLFLARPAAEAPSLRANRPDLVVPDELEALLLRALQREREARFQTAEEMLNALDEVPADATSVSRSRASARGSVGAGGGTGGTSTARSAPAAPAAATPEPRRRRGPRIVLLVVVGLALVGTLTVLSVIGSGGARPPRVRQVEAARRSEPEQRYIGLLDEARLKLHGGDSQGALTAVNQASLLDCRDAEVFLIRSEIYRTRGDLVSALAELDTAANAEPGSPEPHLGRVWIRLEQGDLAGAEQSLERARELAPAGAGVQAARGALALLRGQRDEARKLLVEAVAGDPALAAGHLYLGRLRLEEGDLAGAITALAEAKSRDPFGVQPLLYLAEAYEAQGNLALADAQLDEALRLDPGSGPLRVRRAALLLERGSAGAALEFLRESTERVPQEGRLWILRGVAAQASDDVAGAIEALRRGLDLGVRDPDARCLLGALYQRNGRLEDAVAQYQAVLREEGEYPSANLQLGLALFAQGKYLEARERLERVLSFDDENLQAHLYLGLLFRNVLADEDLAREHLERYRALGGDDPRLDDPR
ncbi:MAG TPA: protein kinase [Planctomycetota bacterium]